MVHSQPLRAAAVAVGARAANFAPGCDDGDDGAGGSLAPYADRGAPW